MDDAPGSRTYRQTGAAVLLVPMLSAGSPGETSFTAFQPFLLPSGGRSQALRPPGELAGSEWGGSGLLEDKAGRPADCVSLCVCPSGEGGRTDGRMAAWGPVLNPFGFISLVLHSLDTRGQSSPELGRLQGPRG